MEHRCVRSRLRFLLPLFLLPLLVVWPLACTDEGVAPLGYLTYVEVFPGEALAGGTIVLGVDTNYLLDIDGMEMPFFTKDNLTFEFATDAGTIPDWTAREVFTVHMSPSSVAAEFYPGAYVTLAVVDTPAALACAGSPPCDATVHVFAGGADTARYGRFSLLGPGGMSSPLGQGIDGSGTLEEDLAPRTLYRLRGRRPATGIPGFGETARIGAMQFDLRLQTACFTPESVRAYPNTEAMHANVVLGPEQIEGSDTVIRVVLVDGQGFRLLKYAPILRSLDAVGEGPLVDITFDWLSGVPGCEDLKSPAVITIEKLLVANPDGGVLIDRRDANPDDSVDYFHRDVLDAG